MNRLTRHIPFVLLAAGLLGACNKYESVDSPDGFGVTTDSTSYKVNTPVTFKFNSNPDQITFWSGENGKQYDNRERSRMAGIPKLVFQTSMQQGLLANPDSLQLLVSTNLEGYDSASIARATWVNISDRNTKWPTTLSTTYTTSDTISLEDFASADKINIAFRVKNGRYATSAQRKWNVQNLTLTNFLPDGTSSALFNSFANTGWVQASLRNHNTPGFMAWNVGEWNRSAGNSINNGSGIAIRSAYPITFDPGTASNVEENDDWLITSAVDLKAVRPDAGVTVKNDILGAFTGLTYVNYTEPGVYAKYQYTFRTPGTYNVTFVAGNYNNDRRAQVVRRMQLTIYP